MIRFATRTLFLATLCFASLALATPALRLDAPKAGIDYPTDAPVPKQLATAHVLVIDAKTRIVIAAPAVLEAPKAGVDYATDLPMPDRLKSAQILVLDGKQRIAVVLETTRSGVAWTFGNAVQLPVASIARVEHAAAGIDFPTDGPPKLDRNFYVAVGKDGKRTRIQ
jgi:hypothetical protein